MSTINVTVSEDLHMQILMLAAHEGVTPGQFVAEAVAEKIKDGGTAFWSLAPGRCAESMPRTLTIIPRHDEQAGDHDHLAPYCQF